MEINQKLANKVLKTVDAGLSKGLGVARPGKMCIEAAVCFALGLPHNDEPPCVGSVVRTFKIQLNDSYWSSKKARARGMRLLAVAQLGSDEINQFAFAQEVVRESIRRILPLLPGIPKTLASLCQKKPNKASVERVLRWAWAHPCTTDSTCAVAAALLEAFVFGFATGNQLVFNAGFATDRVVFAARKIAATRPFGGDKVLRIAADIALEALKKLNSPGCRFLPQKKKTKRKKV